MSQLTPRQPDFERDRDLPPYEPDGEPVFRTDERQYELRDYEPIHPGSRWREIAKKLWAPLAVVGALIWKFKALALAVFKLKIFTTAASMLVSIGAYALLWPWQFALGLVLLLLVHELGHVLELRRQGVPASAPLFIPFLGAVVGMKQMPKDAWREAQVALAGPIIGSLGALGVWMAGEALDSELLIAIAFTGFFLNLFNLIPIVPLDGGRAVGAIHPFLWGIGLVALVGLALVMRSGILLIILLLGGFELWRRWREKDDPAAASYYRVKPWQRVATAATYVGLAASLVLAMHATHIERSI